MKWCVDTESLRSEELLEPSSVAVAVMWKSNPSQPEWQFRYQISSSAVSYGYVSSRA